MGPNKRRDFYRQWECSLNFGSFTATITGFQFHSRLPEIVCLFWVPWWSGITHYYTSRRTLRGAGYRTLREGVEKATIGRGALPNLWIEAVFTSWRRWWHTPAELLRLRKPMDSYVLWWGLSWKYSPLCLSKWPKTTRTQHPVLNERPQV